VRSKITPEARPAVGSFVVTWFDNGLGGTMVYGVVEQAGPLTFTVRWESDARNRCRYAEPRGVDAIEPGDLDDAARARLLRQR
jgi:hypothetical protein